MSETLDGETNVLFSNRVMKKKQGSVRLLMKYVQPIKTSPTFSTLVNKFSCIFCIVAYIALRVLPLTAVILPPPFP